MLVDCDKCEAKVDGHYVQSYEVSGEDGNWRYTFLKCPSCESPFILEQEYIGGDFWDDPIRLYPTSGPRLAPSLPKSIKDSYSEALACMRVKAYTAAAIMCRKTLEAICIEHGVERKLSQALQQMKEKGLIDSRLFEWADALRLFGNDAAHDVSVTISSQDAKDIVEFTRALIEYVFTFRDKFNEFIARRKKEASPQTSPAG